MLNSFLGEPTVQEALSKLLDALRFTQMAKDVQTETDPHRLYKYCCVILKNCPSEMVRPLRQRFRALGLIAC